MSSSCQCHDCKTILADAGALQAHFALAKPCTVCENVHQLAARTKGAGAAAAPSVRKYCNMALHRQEARHILCSTCKCWYFDQHRYDKHLDKGGAVVCFICSTRVCFSALATHNKSKHPSATFECPMKGCGQRLLSEDDAEAHLEQAHYCSECQESFLVKESTKDHKCAAAAAVVDDFDDFDNQPDEWSIHEDSSSSEQERPVVALAPPESKRSTTTDAALAKPATLTAALPAVVLSSSSLMQPVGLARVPSATEQMASLLGQRSHEAQEEIIGRLPIAIGESRPTAAAAAAAASPPPGSASQQGGRKRKSVSSPPRAEQRQQGHRKYRRVTKAFPALQVRRNGGGSRSVWVTIKCPAHNGGPVSRQTLRECRACRKFPGRGLKRSDLL